MASAIVNLWARRVAKADRVLDDVPPALRTEVKAALNMICAAEQLGDGEQDTRVSPLDQLTSALKQRASARL